VEQVPVHVQERLPAGPLGDHVAIPDLREHRGNGGVS
jgi:hypothetical protein